MTDNFQSRTACRQKIFFNQCRVLEKRHPFLLDLALKPTPATAEFAFNLYCQHIKLNDPFAGEINIANTYRTLLKNPATSVYHPHFKRWLARHYIGRGTPILEFCEDSDVLAEAHHQLELHARGYGADVGPYAAARSTNRGASLIHYFSNHLHLLKEKVVGHFAPEPNFKAWFRANKDALSYGYVTLDGFQEGMDAYVDITDTGLPAGMFDVIICHRVLEQVYDDDAALREMLRLLKPGGLLNVSVPENFAFEAPVDWLVPDAELHGHIRQYGSTFIHQIEGAGFDRVEAERWLFTQPMEDLLAVSAYPLLMYNAYKN